MRTRRFHRGVVLGAVVALSTGAMLLAGGTTSGAAPQTENFGFTGASELFQVPAGVYAITVEAFGAAGGAGDDGAPAGNGGMATAVVCVTPGEILQVNVGGMGADGITGDDDLRTSEDDSDVTGRESPDVSPQVESEGGFNGGGHALDTGSNIGGGGGGASDVRRGAFGLADRLIVAGGGGGSGGDSEAD